MPRVAFSESDLQSRGFIFCAICGRQLGHTGQTHDCKGGQAHERPGSAPEVRQARRQNATELQAIAVLPAGDYEFEGKTFPICGGATYTPDWVDCARKVAVEVKGEFIHSRDSRRRFDEARHLHHDWLWIWARKRTSGRKGRRWEIEVY